MRNQMKRNVPRVQMSKPILKIGATFYFSLINSKWEAGIKWCFGNKKTISNCLSTPVGHRSNSCESAHEITYTHTHTQYTNTGNAKPFY